MPYRFLEDIAIADVAFEAWGVTAEEMFMAAAEATANVMIDDLDSISALEQRDIRIEANDMEMLLFNLLQELIYYKDAQQLILRLSQVSIAFDNNSYRLEAKSYGEKIDSKKHALKADVKAVTLHRFRVTETAEGWEACVVLDI